MITYKAAFKSSDHGVHAEVLDFPGVVSCGRDLDHAREMLSGALADMAETYLLHGKPLPLPNQDQEDPEADLEEPIHLLLVASSSVSLLPGHAA